MPGSLLHPLYETSIKHYRARKRLSDKDFKGVGLDSFKEQIKETYSILQPQDIKAAMEDMGFVGAKEGEPVKRGETPEVAGHHPRAQPCTPSGLVISSQESESALAQTSKAVPPATIPSSLMYKPLANDAAIRYSASKSLSNPLSNFRFSPPSYSDSDFATRDFFINDSSNGRPVNEIGSSSNGATVANPEHRHTASKRQPETPIDVRSSKRAAQENAEIISSRISHSPKSKKRKVGVEITDKLESTLLPGPQPRLVQTTSPPVPELKTQPVPSSDDSIGGDILNHSAASPVPDTDDTMSEGSSGNEDALPILGTDDNMGGDISNGNDEADDDGDKHSQKFTLNSEAENDLYQPLVDGAQNYPSSCKQARLKGGVINSYLTMLVSHRKGWITFEIGDEKRPQKLLGMPGVTHVLLSLNPGGVHWVCVLLDMRQRQANIFDSLPDSERVENVMAVIHNMVERAGLGKDRPWKAVDNPAAGQCPKQCNAYDCGVFVAAVSTYLVLDEKLPAKIDAFR